MFKISDKRVKSQFSGSGVVICERKMMWEV